MFHSPRALLRQETDPNPAVFTLDSKMDLKRLAGGGFEQISLERKKDPKVLISMTYRLQWNPADHNLERETRLELATPTLARSCSTN
jgi:hypothetical protein